MKGLMFCDALLPLVLDGRKTQTRRVMKPQPVYDARSCRWEWDARGQDGVIPLDETACDAPLKPGEVVYVKEPWAVHSQPMEGQGCGYVVQYKVDGDVREVAFDGRVKPFGDTLDPVLDGCRHAADKGWRSKLFMPAWAARCFLRVTDVRAERVQDISEADARAEGAEPQIVLPGDKVSVVAGFYWLWDGLHHDKPGQDWPSNPWVWRYRFERTDRPDGERG